MFPSVFFYRHFKVLHLKKFNLKKQYVCKQTEMYGSPERQKRNAFFKNSDLDLFMTLELIKKQFEVLELFHL